MAVKIIDLQLIYGVAGAREKFEELAAQLIRGEQPAAAKVRVSKGDSGIDVHVGELTAPGGIVVYQCKFFPQGLDDSQKGQIRESFKTCRTSTTFKFNRWILCLPVDLSVEEKAWFETWRKGQAKHGVEIADPWCATELEGLLYQPMNQGLREVYFREEHLNQIRELHATLSKLVPDIAKRLMQDAEERIEDRRSEVRARHEEELKELICETRDHFVCVSTAQAAAIQPQLPNHWEIVIRPTDLDAESEIESLKICREIVQKSHVRSHGWAFPHVPHQRETGVNWVGATWPPDSPEVECWRISQQGAFVFMTPITDDVHAGEKGMRIQRPDLSGFIPSKFLDIDVAVRTITHAFRFAAKLLDQEEYPVAAEMSLTIRLTGTKDRVLNAQDSRWLRDRYRATAPLLETSWSVEAERLRRDADELAVKAAIWFFERFNMHENTEEAVRAIQSKIFSEFPRR